MGVSIQSCIMLLSRLLPEPHASLLSGILFGSKTSLDPIMSSALRDTGTSHITSLSGMNITILSAVILSTLINIVPRMFAGIVTIIFIILFVLFVGPSASVVRAGCMGCLGLVGMVLGREKHALWLLGVTVIIMLLLKPSWVVDLSFQLSVFSTVGILLFAGKKQAVVSVVPSTVIGGIIHAIQDDVRITLAAQVFTLPITIFTFRQISLVAPLTNVFIGWTIPIITVLGMCIVILGFVWLPLGQVVAWFGWVFLEYLRCVVLWTAMIPFGTITW